MISSKKPKFNRTNENIEWAPWSWNPVTGCWQACSYCYARAIANRFKNKPGHHFYPHGFTPHFYPERLSMPQNTKLPKSLIGKPGAYNVFTCSMGEIFGEWVPQRWIDAVIDTVRKSTQWNFLFLTKKPSRLLEISWPKNAWVGTTIDIQARVQPAVDIFSKLRATVKFISCEPLQEPLLFPKMDCFDWVIIGGYSPGTKPKPQPPKLEWVYSLRDQAYLASCMVYMKPNLQGIMPVAEILKEYPSVKQSNVF